MDGAPRRYKFIAKAIFEEDCTLDRGRLVKEQLIHYPRLFSNNLNDRLRKSEIAKENGAKERDGY